MKIGVNVSIDVTKIDKSKLFTGKKGKYLDMTVFINDEQDQYSNNGMVTQKANKGEEGSILGNCKVFWSEQVSIKAPQQPSQPPQDNGGFDDDIPF